MLNTMLKKLIAKAKTIPTFFHRSIIGALMISYVVSCGIPEAINDTLAALDRAVATLEANADEWRQTLEELRETVQNDGTAAGQLIDDEVAIMLNRAIDAIDAGLVCNVDFLADRLVDRLTRLRRIIQGLEVGPIDPQLCLVVPFAIHTHEIEDSPFVEFFGFDFDSGIMEAFLESSGGNETDVTTEIDIPTHYNMTINLGSNGVPIDDNSERIVLYSSEIVPSVYDCNGNGRVDSSDLGVLDQISLGTRDLVWCSMADVNGDGLINNGEIDAALQEFNSGPIVLYRNELASVTIIHAQEQGVTIPTISNQTIYPVSTGGDTEFGGNGPEVWIDTSLVIRNAKTELWATMYMKAQETEGNDTVGEITREILVYTVPQGWKIVGINNAATDSLHYIDTDHSDDVFVRGSNGPVSRYTVVGDVFGNDIGSATRATIEFNSISITILGI